MKHVILFIISFLFFAGDSWGQCNNAPGLPALYDENPMVTMPGEDLFKNLYEASNDPDYNCQVPIYISNLSNAPNKTGFWNESSTWCCLENCPTGPNSGIPSENALILIKPGETVKIKTTEIPVFKLIRIEGTLSMLPNHNTAISTETIQVMPKGKFNIGYKVSPVESNKTAIVNFVPLGGECDFLNNDMDPNRISRGLISYMDAKIRVWGADKTSRMILNVDIEKNAQQITGIPSNWKISDHIVLAGTIFKKNDNGDPGEYNGDPDRLLEDELLEITGISGNTITTFNNLSDNNSNKIKFSHKRTTYVDDSGSTQYFDLHLANMTRNVVFKTDNVVQGSHISEDPIFDRAHIMFMGKGDVIIENAQFKDLGRTNKSIALDDITNIDDNISPGTGFTPNQYGVNTRGRYALHFHQNNIYNQSRDNINSNDGFSSNLFYLINQFHNYDPLSDNHINSTVKGSVVWGTPGWGFVNHTSIVSFHDNIAYDFVGSGFVTESGDEIGSFTDNIAIGGRGEKRYRDIRLVFNNPVRPLPLSDFGFNGEGFWFQGPMIKATRNIASSCNGAGMFWFTVGGLNTNTNYFIGVDNEVARAVYGGMNNGAGYSYPSNGNCDFTSLNMNQNYFDINFDLTDTDTTNDEYNNYTSDLFRPRTWNSSQEIFLADLPIMECSDFQAYGCLAGLRIRFNNAPSNFLIGGTDFQNFGSFGYNSELDRSITEELNDGEALGFSPREALRVFQEIKNLRLWNNDIGIRARYLTKTHFNDIKVANELRHHKTVPHKGIETDHRVEELYYCNTDVTGYALANDVLEDYPENPCDLNGVNFYECNNDPLSDCTPTDDNDCNVQESVMQVHDNFGVFCPVPENIHVSIIRSNNVTITWDETEDIDRIGIRYLKDEDIYWKYIWKNIDELPTPNSYKFDNLTEGENYKIQLVSGCFMDPSSFGGELLNHLPYANAVHENSGENCEFVGNGVIFPYATIGKNSYWSEELLVDVTCEQLSCGYNKNSTQLIPLNMTFGNCVINACDGDLLRLRVTRSTNSNAIPTSSKWFDPNGEEITTNIATNGVLTLNFDLDIHDYGIYRAEFEYPGASCIHTKTFKIEPNSDPEIAIGYYKSTDYLDYNPCTGSSTEEIKANVLYTCMTDIKLGLLGIDPSDPDFNKVEWKWTNNGETINLPDGIDICISYDNYGFLNGTYTATLVLAGCTTEYKIDVRPQSNTLCKYYIEKEVSGLLTGQREFKEAIDCQLSLNCEDKVSPVIRMFNEQSKLSSTIWHLTVKKANGDEYKYKIPGTKANELKFDNFPNVIIPNLSATDFLEGIDIEAIKTLPNGSDITLAPGTRTVQKDENDIYIFEIEVYDIYGCSSIHEFTVEDLCSSETRSQNTDPIITDKASTPLKLYPNPTNNNSFITLSFHTKESQKQFFIYDLNGKLIRMNKFQTTEGENTQQVNIANFPQGMYYISDGKELHAKFVVM